MSVPTAPAQHAVVAGFDGSDGARSAVAWAAQEAVRRRCPLVIAQCLDWAPPVMPGWAGIDATGGEQLQQHAERQLSEVAETARKMDHQLVVETVQMKGKPGVLLPELAGETGAVLLVAGASGRGALPRALLGSTAADLVRTAQQPVVVVRGTSERGPVVVGVDGSPTSDRALEFAFEFADRHRAPLVAAHAWADWPVGLLATAPMAPVGRERVDEGLEQAVRSHVDQYAARFPDVRAEVRFDHVQPAQLLTDLAEEAQLLVVGSHGRGPVARTFLGSVSHSVLYHAPCPVAVLRETENH